MRRILLIAVCGLVIGLSGFASESAFGCPMCSQANETKEDADLPAAYMYSILFMLAVPATVFTGFGIGLYRLSKKNAEIGSDAETEAVRHLTPPHHLSPQFPGTDEFHSGTGPN